MHLYNATWLTNSTTNNIRPYYLSFRYFFNTVWGEYSTLKLSGRTKFGWCIVQTCWSVFVNAAYVHTYTRCEFSVCIFRLSNFFYVALHCIGTKTQTHAHMYICMYTSATTNCCEYSINFDMYQRVCFVCAQQVCSCLCYILLHVEKLYDAQLLLLLLLTAMYAAAVAVLAKMLCSIAMFASAVICQLLLAACRCCCILLLANSCYCSCQLVVVCNCCRCQIFASTLMLLLFAFV